MTEGDLVTFDAFCINKQRNNQQGKFFAMCCKESEESIVVMKLKPMNLGNKLEGKISMSKGILICRM